MLRFFPAEREVRNEEYQPKKFVKTLEPFLEVKRENWKPIKVDGNLPPKIVFIDGVRRTEYRVEIFDGNRFAGEGIFISIGAGALLIDRSLDRVDYKLLYRNVKRYFIHNAKGVKVPPRWETTVGETKLVFETMDSPMENVSEYANGVMKKMELEVLRQVYGSDIFVVSDGPVKTTKFLPNVIYLVKESRYFYLQGLEEVLFNIKGGERTPLFLFEEEAKRTKGGKTEGVKVKKVGCYVRLAPVHPQMAVENPLAGIARLEVPHGGDLKLLKEIMEKGASVAVYFANDPLRDRRSPQNLTPIAALEKELRRLLGKYEIIRRRVGTTLLSLLSGS
ncbi:MAG TPA: hypothetical protein EYH37_06060 [Aquifex aeolicus]|uniref:NurA domain-containing protein n=1 Tax=Aquifex aeolicus TaxID=63363 RepID=A0A9D1CGU7_AQUAO|nr:hypothetical protein [Aquifex aeolicus]